MQTWYNYADLRPENTVVGELKVAEGVYSPQLHNRRRLFVHLPPSYAAQPEWRYPVIYMQDGQNLFDQSLSYAGEWQVDETMAALSHEGIEAIIVGIANAETRRIDEYGPFKDLRLRRGGRGDWYVAFMANTVKPLIDREFRTLPEREHTGVMGSSLGGLISLYAFFGRPDIFGFAGVMSPSLWFAQEAIFSYVRQSAFRPGQIYLDLGTHEGGDTRPARRPPHKYTSRYLTAARHMRDMLAAKGYTEGHLLRYEEEDEAVHNEEAWARRLPGALRFLLGRYRRTPVALAGQPMQLQTEPWLEF